MGEPRSARIALGAVLVVALFGGAAGLQWLRESRFPPGPAAKASLYVTSGNAARQLTKGYNALAADLYWIRTIQYYGDLKLRMAQDASLSGKLDADRYELLYPLLDMTTSLDPGFHIAYRFGSIFLAEAFPGGAGHPDLAIALLEKGIRARPDKWEYMQDAGFVHYWWKHDYKAAAEWFRRAGDVPGAPWFLKSIAATTLAEGGDRKSSRTMWLSIRESAVLQHNDWLRNESERRLMQLDAMDFIAEVQQGVDRWIARMGRAPESWNELIRDGAIRGIPTDATGVPYVLDVSGQVLLSSTSKLSPLPDEPKRIGGV